VEVWFAIVISAMCGQMSESVHAEFNPNSAIERSRDVQKLAAQSVLTKASTQ